MPNYPFLDVAAALKDARGWLRDADDTVGEAFSDRQTGEPYPTPAALDEAQALWQQAEALLEQALARLQPHVDEEQERYDEDEARWCRE